MDPVPKWQQSVLIWISTISFINGTFVLWNTTTSYDPSWVATKLGVLAIFVFTFHMVFPLRYVIPSIFLHFCIGGSHWYQLWSMGLLWSLGLNSLAIFVVYIFPVLLPTPNPMLRPTAMGRTMLSALVFCGMMMVVTWSFHGDKSDMKAVVRLHHQVGCGLVVQSVLFLDSYNIIRLERYL